MADWERILSVLHSGIAEVLALEREDKLLGTWSGFGEALLSRPLARLSVAQATGERGL